MHVSSMERHYYQCKSAEINYPHQGNNVNHKTLAVPFTVALLASCGGGEGSFFGDGGARVLLEGPIMGQQRTVCVDQPPVQMTPAALQAEIDKYLFKSIRFDNGATVNKKIEGDRSCAYKLSPYQTISWAKFVAGAENQQLQDWGTFTASVTSTGQRQVTVCVWDNECEDGDIIALQVNGNSIGSVELRNAQQCFAVNVNSGLNYLGVLAVNGTGFKGNCNFGDRNTGVVSVRGATGQSQQTYSVTGGQGSYGAMQIVN